MQHQLDHIRLKSSSSHAAAQKRTALKLLKLLTRRT
jgi:hypothetical protein